jgi:hypothetical protein
MNLFSSLESAVEEFAIRLSGGKVQVFVVEGLLECSGARGGYVLFVVGELLDVAWLVGGFPMVGGSEHWHHAS